jgi:hypothetical protein
VDDRDAPIYRLSYPQRPEEREVVERNAEIYEWYRGLDHEIAWVVDCSQVRYASARVRQLQAQHVQRIEPFAARWDVCDAFVVPSPMLRGYMTAIFWFSRPPYDYQTFAEVGPAYEWVRSRLERRKLARASVPPA